MNKAMTAERACGLLALMDCMPERFAAEMLDAGALDLSEDAALPDFPEAALSAAELLTAERPARSVWVSALMATAGTAACIAVLFGVIWALNRSREMRNGGVSMPETDFSAETQTDRTEASLSTTVSTVSTVQTESTQSKNPTASTDSTAAPSTDSTAAPADTETTAAPDTTAAQAEQTDATASETVLKVSGADPGAVIAELKAGRRSEFCWDETDDHLFVRSWQTYGVAFLCNDAESLKNTKIAGHPVYLSAGTWSQFGGTPWYHDSYWDTAIDANPDIGYNDCMVQRLADFEAAYGIRRLADGRYTRYNKEVSCAEITALRREYEADGQTACMASIAGDDLKFTQASGNTAYDYSEIIRAIAADDSMTLIGLVWGREDLRGELPEAEVHIRLQFAEGYLPKAEDYAAFGELQYFVGHWEIVTALSPAETMPPGHSERQQPLWSELRRICTALEERPEILSAVPDANYVF